MSIPPQWKNQKRVGNCAALLLRHWTSAPVAAGSLLRFSTLLDAHHLIPDDEHGGVASIKIERVCCTPFDKQFCEARQRDTASYPCIRGGYRYKKQRAVCFFADSGARVLETMERFVKPFGVIRFR